MRILSGIQTSGNGELHLGNYLGAIKQWIELQDKGEAFYMLANLHAITVPIEPAVLKENIYKVTALYLALGLDPQKSTIFVQSLVPQHMALNWLLNTVVTTGELRRMTQFKDKAGQDQESVSAGLFNYPILMAADILLYQAGQVPVGEDQKQHVELTRNIAERFNNRFGQTFTLPDVYTPSHVARIMSLDDPTKKMSKSLGASSYIGLLDKAETIQDKMKRSVTDSDNEIKFDPQQKPAVSNLLSIFSSVTDQPIATLEADYQGKGYGQLKTDLAEVLIDWLTPIQIHYQRLIADRAHLENILNEGSQKASSVAEETLHQVKEKMGVW